MLSGNRNFEGRVNPDVRANYLASPPLVVAYALAGSMKIDITTEPLGEGKDGKPVYLKDIWPTTEEIAALQRKVVTTKMFAKRYADVFKGDENWQGIKVAGGQTYAWDMGSTYVQNPPYFEGMTMSPTPVTDIVEARVLARVRRLDHHRPHLARPARSRQTSPGRRLSARAPGADRRTSTPTARAAATTK